MSPDGIELSPIDDTPVYNVYIANRASAVLAVAVRLGLFARLDEGPRTSAEIGEALGLRPRPVAAMLQALVSLGLLVTTGTRYALSRTSAEYLVPGRSAYLGGLVDLDFDVFMTPAALLEAMKKDRTTAFGAEDVWGVLDRDEEAALKFTLAMHSISARPAAALARTYDFGKHRRLFDVGGGSGVIAIAAAASQPGLRVTILDRPKVLAIARRFVENAGLSDRVDTAPLEFFREPLPSGADAILFSQIFHDWRPETGAMLARKAFDALPRSGTILVHEKLLDDDGTGPLANALVSLDMLVWTEGQQWTGADLARTLREAGFEEPTITPTIGYWSVVTARKP